MRKINQVILFSLFFVIISWKPSKTILTDISPASVKFKKNSCKLDNDLKEQIKNIIIKHNEITTKSDENEHLLLCPSNLKEEWQKNRMIGFCRTYLIIDYLSENELWSRDRIIVMEPEPYAKFNEPLIYFSFVVID
jgi:hypothetical protein